MAGDRAELLVEDPDLGQALRPDALLRAQSAATAECLELPAGCWSPADALPPGSVGYLVLGGLLVRDVAVAGGVCSELLGCGDLLRPWDDDRAGAPLPAVASWMVLAPARLAVLDRAFAEAIAEWPEVSAELHSRMIHRARWLACLLALSHLPRLEPRLLGLLWHLADRWGRVERSGVVMPLPLSHGQLGRLIGARRPSVTRSLRRLAQAGAVSAREDGGWRLHGEASAMLERIARPPVTRVTGPPR